MSPSLRRAKALDADELLAEILQHTTDAFIVLDADWRFTYVNAAGAQVLRLTENVIGRVLFEQYPRLLEHPLGAMYRRVMSDRVQERYWGPMASMDTWVDALALPTGSGITIRIQDTTAAHLAALRTAESETRLHEFMEQSSQVFWITEVGSGGPSFISRSFRQVWGRSAEEIQHGGRDAFLATIHPEDRERVGRELRGPLQHAVELRYRIVRPDGSVRHIADRSFPIRDAIGHVHRTGGIAQDVTEHEEAIAALTRSEELFRALTENSAEMISVRDATGAFTYVSPSAARLLGYAPEELVGHTAMDLVHPDDRERLRERLGVVLATRGVAPGTRMRLRHKDGNYRVIDGTARNMVDHPVVRGILSNSRDVTDAARAEAAVSFQASLLEAVQQAVVSLDMDGRVNFWNGFAERLYGWSADEAMGRTLFELIIPPDSVPIVERILRNLVAGGAWEGDFHLARKDGSCFMAHTATSGIANADGAITGMIGVTTDVSDRIRVEEQLRQSQKMDAVGKLAGGVAHDFNNLLTVIKAHAEFLEESVITEQGRDDLAEVRKAASRAAGLTRQLLAFSRQQVMEPRVVHFNVIASDIQKMLSRLIGEDIELRVSLDADTPPVFADRGQLEQVLMNLAVNARDAMPRGGELRIATERREVDGATYAALVVSDSGEGMTHEVRARMFEPFFTTKEAGRGTGLGLATVYGIVDQSNGFITCDTHVGVGTTFTVLLPETVVTAVDGAEVAAGVPVQLSGTETVLLVEDEQEVRRIASRILAARGYSVLEAKDGGEALALLAGGDVRVDLLLTDAIMPGISGPELAVAVSSIAPGMPVVVMSGYTDDELMRRGDLGVEHVFLHKPFTSVGLLTAVREALGESPLESS
ncbi:MAG: hybrid sensor histidine kinase/response regulator [Gemmatimonadetes bacterium]|nr:hybrid sensor histidine kinase/response regulator [Gemmatimonadota bacterium]